MSLFENRDENKQLFILIGCNHRDQIFDGAGSDLLDLLKKAIIGYKPDLLAEEFNEEALSRYKKGTRSVLGLLGVEFGIQHCFIDPDTKERKSLGIPTRREIKSKLSIQGPVLADSNKDSLISAEAAKYHGIRELCWLKKVQNNKFTKVLFLCGSLHINSFEKILKKRKYLVAKSENNF